MRVLFTGHLGFLGRELIPRLERHVSVVTYPYELDDFHDLKNFVKRQGVEAIIHAAARGGRRTKQDDERVLISNLASSLNVAHLELPTAIFCSGAIYGRHNSIFMAHEDSSGDTFPQDFYGQSKFLFREIAKSLGNVSFLRYFNVFGLSEGFDRFISFNIKQYVQRQPIVIYRDFYMDFFYVLDSEPVILDWLGGRTIPREINLVYSEKIRLTGVGSLINDLGASPVPIIVLDDNYGNNYCGDSSVLDSLNYSLIGLNEGIRQMYLKFKE